MSRHVERSYGVFDDTALRADVIQFMDRYKVSQRWVADEIGMSPGTVNRWFRGDGRVGADFAASLALLCDLNLNDYTRVRT